MVAVSLLPDVSRLRCRCNVREGFCALPEEGLSAFAAALLPLRERRPWVAVALEGDRDWREASLGEALSDVLLAAAVLSVDASRLRFIAMLSAQTKDTSLSRCRVQCLTNGRLCYLETSCSEQKHTKECKLGGVKIQIASHQPVYISRFPAHHSPG